MANPGLFNSRIAARYDEIEAEMYHSTVLGPAVQMLSELSGGERALEFAIGTGRVAIPLHASGVEVLGIELSQPMVDQLRLKPGGDQISVTIGDMASASAGSGFQLVYLVYNTITNLISQNEQVKCFCHAAAHLKAGGYFLIEVDVPMLAKLPSGERLNVFDLTSEHIGIDEYNLSTQQLTSHHIWINGDQVERFDSIHRYAWPAEYDLMARIAGLSLVGRWSNWKRDSFTDESRSHISLWQKK